MRAARNVARDQQRGKAVVWVLVFVAIGAAAWWYFLPQTLPASIRAALPPSPNAHAQVYKWRDAKGRLQLTSTPPTDRPYETVEYDPNLNVLPAAATAQP
jgi:hypothetical protein